MSKVFELFEKNHIVDHVRELTPYLEKRLDELVEKYDFLSCRRGKGFMQGLVVTGRPVGEILKKALENDLIILSAGNDVIRLVPPLVIEKEHIDEMIEKLEKSMREAARMMEYEYAAVLRDEIIRLRGEVNQVK